MRRDTHITPDVTVEFTGVISERARVCTRILDGALTVPVVVVTMECDAISHPVMTLEQAFSLGQHAQAAEAAKALTKGQRITARMPLSGLRVVAPNVSDITLDAAPAAPTHHQPEPDLFGAAA